jgi:hypothetical protein
MGLSAKEARKILPLVIGGSLFLSACSPQLKSDPSGSEVLFWAPTAQAVETPQPTNYLDVPRARPEKRLLPYIVDLPPQIKGDLTKIIWYTLISGGAKNLDSYDFYHCHTLLTKEQKNAAYHGTLSGWINGVIRDSLGLLCHGQELTSDRPDLERRNTVIWTGGEPFTVPLASLQPREISQGTYTAWPEDLGSGISDGVQLSFSPSPDGSLVLPNGIRLQVFVDHPESYTLGHTPKDMTVDLP